MTSCDNIRKTCTKCNVEKSITEFSKHNTGKHGVASVCKPCHNAYQKAHRSKTNNKRSTESKECSVCHEIKDAEHFYSDRNSSDGLRSECKACNIAYTKARQSTLNNPRSTEHKKCIMCNEIKDAEHFGSNKNNSDGLNSYCKACENIRIKARKDKQTPEQFLRNLYNNARHRTKKSGKPFELVFDDVMNLWNEQRGLCALTGVQMTHKSAGLYNGSIDRIDSSKEYTVDNIQMVSVIAQIIKQDNDMETLKLLMKQIGNYDGVKGMKALSEQMKKFIKNGLKQSRETHNKRTKKGREYAYDIDQEYIEKLYEEQGGVCAISGIEMACKTHDIYNLSIDRIDSSKGYTKENVHLVCAIINNMKNEYSMDEFMKECENMYNHLNLA